jgi:ribosomal protein S18 acetylase RimI-like enzyme
VGGKATRDRLLEFELELDAATCDELVEERWGRAYLCPSLPLVWDASWLAIEEAGMELDEVIGLADRVLGGAGFAHRTVAIIDEAEGRRLLGEAKPPPGWKVERARYMLWTGDTDRRPAAEVRETTLAEVLPLRRELIRSWLPASEADPARTVEELLEMDRRYGDAAGDRWLVAPACEPAAACRLLEKDGIGQVEEVATAGPARGRGLAQAVVLRAIAESREANDVTFIVADADDWPGLMYEKLGFTTVGQLHILRRRPEAGVG